MRSYRNASSSASPTSAGTWALIVTAICACCAAVATSRRPWERTAGYRDMYDPRYGRRRRSSSARAPLAWPTSYRPGSDTTCSSGSRPACPSSKPTKGSIAGILHGATFPFGSVFEERIQTAASCAAKTLKEVISTNLLDDIGGGDNTLV